MAMAHQVLATATQLGAVLQAARKSQGMAQSALAGRIGLSQSRVSHLELHAHELSLEQLLAWCAALGLELSLGPSGGQAPPLTAHADSTRS
ncbi:helix-turn-helix domain-containing protein [Pigmentiphaga kullae]|uniref:HTH-type transcriptional regulator/antitoxin HipB n=1 Tax=Pigmentiphaga kullae TaxID=151784 RepID=A0A4Q7NCW7_9BURK|nr:helix-turn-helix transcriptional regulator [Pigmentiphaga kullae]RZS80805.1 HTH-type transcriptional regulator/antitoxin HipB [Pigmentiphaga kullae]